jgi:Prealbumin-like fold domain
MRVQRICFIIAMLASACMAQTQSGINGTIGIAPFRPGPARVGEPTTKPLPDFAFVVEKDGGAVASFTTDAQGHFEVALPPGHYKVRPKEKQSSIGRYGPWEVDVSAGKMTPVEWRCDSGMR